MMIVKGHCACYVTVKIIFQFDWLFIDFDLYLLVEE